MLKKELRKKYKQMRNQLTVRQINASDDLLLIQFQKLTVDIPELLMTYAPIEKFNEFDPQLITDYCYFKNPALQLIYPVMKTKGENNAIVPVLVNDDTVFTPGLFDVYEPVNALEVDTSVIDMVIVPLLCFDTNGYRVGYGKGYYDRFLQQCGKQCTKVGFSYFEPVNAIDDVNEFDIQLDFCITPESIYEF